MNRFVPLVLGVLLIGGLVYVNRSMNKGTEADMEKQAAAEQQAAQPPPPKPAPAAPTPSVPVPFTKQNLPPELVLGNPQAARYKITFGYVYDEAVQPNPQVLTAVSDAVQAAQKGRADVSAIIVDLDIPPTDRSPSAQSVTQEGVAVNGVPTDAAHLAAALKP